MKPLAITIYACLLLTAGAVMSAAQTTAQADKLLESARHKEVMDGDLKGAIEQYRQIATQFAKQPEIAAKALLQMGQCQEKLGQSEARKSYERILREYGGAQEYASAARARLAALGGGPVGQEAARFVWAGPKIGYYACSLSPDGRYMTFPDPETGNLALHDLVSGADRALTNSASFKPGEGAFAEDSSISRDGKQVAYAWWDQKRNKWGLWVLNLNGDAIPRRVFEASLLQPYDWSPDRKWIAANLRSADGTRQMGLIGVQDGSLHVLRSGTALLIGGFSPDGRYIAYTQGRQGFIMSVDGKSEVPLVPGPSSVESPVWTPDGSRIAFVSDRSGSPGLWSIQVSDGRPVGEPELLKTGFNNIWLTGFARDGSLYYAVDLYQTDIYIAALNPATGKLTSEPRRVNQRAVGNSWGRVAWLPDGKALSFWNREPVGALVVHTLATGEEREIWGGKSGRPKARYAGWFPDGGSLMAWQDNSENWVFRRVDSRTLDVQASWTVPALPQPSGRNPVFTPDLMSMYFPLKDPKLPCNASRCPYIMLARDLESGRDHELFRIDREIYGVSISADGRQIAFYTADGNGRLMVAPTSGGAPREIYRFSEQARIAATAWTPDGGHILAFRTLRVGAEAWSIPTNGGTPEKTSLRMNPTEMHAVSPDGSQVAFVGVSPKAEF